MTDKCSRDMAFTAMNFMGNGDLSIARCYVLMDQLHRAFDLMGGLQQGPTEPKDWEDVHFYAENIYTALTGQLITGVMSPEGRTPERSIYHLGHLLRLQLKEKRNEIQ